MAPTPARKSPAKAAAGRAAALLAAPLHLSLPERRELGREARRKVPRSSHGGWEPAAGRRDPVTLLEEQNTTRVPWLV
ncbi:MAG TPA: hypothetical protein VIJ15_06210, partial [Dermatophilaceae bacterium]